MAVVTTRMLPANASGGTVSGSLGPAQQPTKVVSCAVGSAVDVAGFGDASEANALVSQGFVSVCASGTAATRRSLTPGGNVKAGTLWLDVDNTSQGVIVFDGLAWRLPTGVAVS
jgi:hypothetical protein